MRRIAIVGTGVIGASWAAYYLSRGFDVVATDPAPNAESNLRKYVDDAWSELAKVGLVVARGGRVRTVLLFTIVDDKIQTIDAVSDPLRLATLEVSPLPQES